MWDLYQDKFLVPTTNKYYCYGVQLVSARSNIWIQSKNLAVYVTKYKHSHAVDLVPPGPYMSSKKIAAHDHMTIPYECVLIT